MNYSLPYRVAVHFIILLAFAVAVRGADTRAAAPQTRPAALGHRSWQFHDPNWEYLQQAIPRAKAAGMNRIQLSHDIIMDSEQLWEGPRAEERLQLVRKIIELAHRNGLAVDLWTHELSGVPKGLVEKGPEAVWAWVRQKYERVFQLLPEADGLVLTFAETQVPVYKVKISDEPPAQRVAKLINCISEVCARHNKLLIVRTFVYEPQEIEFMREALGDVAKTAGGRGNVVVMTKCVPHDWTPYYPYDPLLGDAGGLPQVVELDLGQEFTGQSSLIHCEVDYVRRALEHARSKGVVGAVARVERRSNHALGTPNEVNIHAFSRLVQDPSLATDTLWIEWASARYGAAAAPLVVRALERSFDITNIIYFPLEQWISNHSVLGDWNYATGHIRERGNAKWIHSPRQERLRDLLLHPTPDVIRQVGYEKDWAMRLVEESLKDLERAKATLKEADYGELQMSLRRLQAGVEIAKCHDLLLFTTEMCADATARGRLTPEELATWRAEAGKHAQSLQAMADRLEKRELPASILATPAQLRSFAANCVRKLPR